MNTTIEKIERLNLLLLGVGAFAGWATALVHVPSFLLGGGVMHANFWLLKKIVPLFLFRMEKSRQGKVRAILLLLIKGGLFLLLLSLLFVRYPVEPLSFMAGVSLLLVTSMIVSLGDSRGGAQDAIPEKDKP